MENLKTLVGSLSPGEEKLVRHFYKLREFGEYRKRLQLFDILLNEKIKDENALAKVLGYTVSNPSYHNIKSRLKSDIVCVLLMQESSCKFNTQYAQAMFSCRRAMLTGEILLSRGVYKEGITLLRKAAKIAEKYELYAERIMTEDALRSHYAGSNHIGELNSGTDAIDESYHLLGQMLSSKKKLYSTVFPESSTVNEDEPAYGTGELLEELESLESESGSTRVNFYSKLSRLNILHSSGDLAGAIQCAQQLLSEVKKNPVVMSSANLGGIHLELSNMYLRTLDFAAAELHAEQACALFRKGMLNHMRACTLIFYARAHAGQYSSAEEMLGQVLASRCLTEPQYEILGQRLNLVASWFEFALGRTDSAARYFRNCGNLAKEKGAWYFGFSLLEALLLTDKGAHEAAIYKLDALRKLVARAKKDHTINRVLICITVLKQLIRCNNDYFEVAKAASKEIVQLMQPSAEATWDPTGFEIIPLDMLVRMRLTKTVRLA
jgi:tetratricopeptide (TPR) repeat protein